MEVHPTLRLQSLDQTVAGRKVRHRRAMQRVRRADQRRHARPAGGEVAQQQGGKLERQTIGRRPFRARNFGLHSDVGRRHPRHLVHESRGRFACRHRRHQRPEKRGAERQVRHAPPFILIGAAVHRCGGSCCVDASAVWNSFSRTASADAPTLNAAQLFDLTGASDMDLCAWKGRLKHIARFMRAAHASIPSSSSIMRSIRPRPPCQKPGSRASSPNGASSSACVLVPPAASMAR